MNINLPSVEVLDEFNMMFKFYKTKYNTSNNEVKDIKSLKDCLEKNGLLSEWYDYRENIEKEIAINWCRENNIEYL